MYGTCTVRYVTVRYRYRYGTVLYGIVRYRTVRYGTLTVRYGTVLKTVRFLAWRTRVRWESERRTEGCWYLGRNRRFSGLPQPARQGRTHIHAMHLTNTTLVGSECTYVHKVGKVRHCVRCQPCRPCPRNKLQNHHCNYFGAHEHNKLREKKEKIPYKRA